MAVDPNVTPPVPDGGQVGIGALLLLLGGGLVKLGQLGMEKWIERKKAYEKAHLTREEKASAVLMQQGKDFLSETRRRLDATEQGLKDCEKRHDECEVKVDSLEEQLRQQGAEFTSQLAQQTVIIERLVLRLERDGYKTSEEAQ